MRLYHFTQKKNINSILQHGIQVGLTPYQDLTDLKAVSLTSIADCNGHGLIKGDVLRQGTDPEYQIAAQHYPLGNRQLSDGQHEVAMFDQTEAMIEIELEPNSSKLLSHQQLFDKLMTNHFMKGCSQDELNYWNAAVILSAEYPFGTEHISKQQLDRERYEIINGKRKHNAGSWYFYLGTVTPQNITQVSLKQSNNKYQTSNARNGVSLTH